MLYLTPNQITYLRENLSPEMFENISYEAILWNSPLTNEDIEFIEAILVNNDLIVTHGTLKDRLPHFSEEQFEAIQFKLLKMQIIYFDADWVKFIALKPLSLSPVSFKETIESTNPSTQNFNREKCNETNVEPELREDLNSIIVNLEKIIEICKSSSHRQNDVYKLLQLLEFFQPDLSATIEENLEKQLKNVDTKAKAMTIKNNFCRIIISKICEYIINQLQSLSAKNPYLCEILISVKQYFFLIAKNYPEKNPATRKILCDALKRLNPLKEGELIKQFKNNRTSGIYCDQIKKFLLREILICLKNKLREVDEAVAFDTTSKQLLTEGVYTNSNANSHSLTTFGIFASSFHFSVQNNELREQFEAKFNKVQ